MLRAALKAGIIIGIVVTVVDAIHNALLLNVVTPNVIYLPEAAPPGPPPPEYMWALTADCLLSLLIPLLWFVAGILAARFGGAAALTTGAGAGAGALAGAIAQTISRSAQVVMNFIMLALGLVNVPFSPGTIQWLAHLGVRPYELLLFLTANPTSGEPNPVEPVGAGHAASG